ncbi:hypothetical protein AALP_AA8G505700 [Arabis alpina]|uniref:Protein kinase domain-containing protein n=1 Tax=Arabis alpina TaxID=50452 RepID=A0A087GER0_ARAAL|nr:hypothetical protein AALP_AA8G505700 [Arabis alpina]
MRETLFFLFFTTLTIATQTTGSINCQTGSSFGYPIRFNCSNITGDAQIGEFVIQEITNTSIYVKIPPMCNRQIHKIDSLFGENHAPSNSQNVILVQECNRSSSSSDCSIRMNRFVEENLNLSRCKSPVSCLERATTEFDVMSIGDVGGCKYWFSSVTTESRDGKPGVSLNLGLIKLDWWITEGCGNTNCSENANCTEVKLPGGGLGHRCTCNDGFRGDAFTVNGGCRSVHKHRGLYKLIGLGTGILVGVLLIAILIYAYIYRQKRFAYTASTSIANRLLCELAGNSSVPFYTYKEIEKATDSFSDKNKLGTGAYGTVYAGELPNSSWVAIKRLKHIDTSSIDQVLNEVKLVSSVSHPNLVRLLGCCISQGEPFLVYEFMSNGTLSQHLQHERGDTPLSWPFRLSIASQTANAIAHLHSSVNPPIYHRDIKSSNILLDYEFNSKLSDFGLSRLGMTTDFDMSHISTAPQGFKVIDFTRPCDEVNLAVLAVDRIGRGRVKDIVDPCLKTENDPKMFASIHNLAELAFRCLSFHRNMRPTMLEVTEDLQQIKLMYFGIELGKFRNRSQESSPRVRISSQDLGDD